MSVTQELKKEQEIREELNNLIRQYAKLEVYRQSLAEELRQMMQQRTRLKNLHRTVANSGTLLSIES